jgi:hypothetical protein
VTTLDWRDNTGGFIVVWHNRRILAAVWPSGGVWHGSVHRIVAPLGSDRVPGSPWPTQAEAQAAVEHALRHGTMPGCETLAAAARPSAQARENALAVAVAWRDGRVTSEELRVALRGF